MKLNRRPAKPTSELRMPYNDRLFQLLQALDDAELESIWVSALRCKPDDREFQVVSHEMKVALVSAEWRAVHGHTLRNLGRRDHQLPWKRILIDVADKLNPGWKWTPYKMDDSAQEEDIERQILEFFDARTKVAWEAMDEKDKAKFADQVNAEMAAASIASTTQARRAGVAQVTTASLGAGIGAGLIAGSGILQMAAGATSFAMAGVLGGTLYQVGVWVVVRLLGVVSGAQLAAGGGAAAVGGAVLSAPAAVAFLANAAMSTSYRKTIPATLFLLSAHELRRQLSTLG